MAFSEALKLAVRRCAHFSCAVCHDHGVEIHHLLPQAEGGPDTDENACPLCPSCHEKYGANPTKRKFLREARDNWYDLCAKRFVSDAAQIEQFIHLFENLATKEDVVGAIRQAKESPPAVTNSDEISELPIELKEAPLTEVAVKGYLRWMYSGLRHSGSDAVRSLTKDLLTIGYRDISELHRVLALTKEAVADVVQAKRDEGVNMDSHSDIFAPRLMLAVLDERWCQKFHPSVANKFERSGHWVVRTKSECIVALAQDQKA